MLKLEASVGKQDRKGNGAVAAGARILRNQNNTREVEVRMELKFLGKAAAYFGSRCYRNPHYQLIGFWQKKVNIEHP